MNMTTGKKDFWMCEPEPCRNSDACGHWVWRHGWERCVNCPYRRPDEIPSANNDNERTCDPINVPLDSILAERLTMLNLALAFRSSFPCDALSATGNVIAEIFQASDAQVIDNDGVIIDLQRTAASAIFQYAFSQGWIAAFFAGKIGSPDRIALQRIKLIWIALTLYDRQRAFEILT